MHFDVICADPCWSFSDALNNKAGVPRGAEANYKTMSVEQIKNIPVKDLISPTGSVLFLWVPSSLLDSGLAVMEAWKFDMKQTYVWNKTKVALPKDLKEPDDLNQCLGFGMGRLFRQTHEIALIGISSTAVYKKLKSKSERSVCLAPNEGHSIKPEHPYLALERQFPGATYLEMFARRVRPGWTCIGNQVPPYEDITEAVKKLAETV
jgi:N6-adenosine-specific RNA methylase IME4